MAEEIAFRNGRISNFEWLVTLTLPLDRVILHTVVHHYQHARFHYYYYYYRTVVHIKCIQQHILVHMQTVL